MKIKREKQELEMQVSQVKINKSIVEVEANKVDNLESKFTTLRGELKEEHQALYFVLPLYLCKLMSFLLKANLQLQSRYPIIDNIALSCNLVEH
jgi:hypothetical protein